MAFSDISLSSFLWNMKEKLSLHITKRSEHVLQWSKANFFTFFLTSFLACFLNTTRKKLVTLDFSVKKKSIWNWIHTLYDYWNFISFLIQQTFVYLVLNFIFILVCSHYRNRTLSVLHNLRNSLVCTDKKFKSSIRETWRVILGSVSWHILYRITAHPRGAFISVEKTPTETNLLLLTTWKRWESSRLR